MNLYPFTPRQLTRLSSHHRPIRLSFLLPTISPSLASFLAYSCNLSIESSFSRALPFPRGVASRLALFWTRFPAVRNLSSVISAFRSTPFPPFWPTYGEDAQNAFFNLTYRRTGTHCLQGPGMATFATGDVSRVNRSFIALIISNTVIYIVRRCISTLVTLLCRECTVSSSDTTARRLTAYM